MVDNTWPADVPAPGEYFGVAFDIAAVVGVTARRRRWVGGPGPNPERSRSEAADDAVRYPKSLEVA